MALKPSANGKAPEPTSAAAPAAAKKEKVQRDAEDFLQKPDQAAYNAEQDGYRAEIDALTTKLNAVKSKIALATGDKSAAGGPEASRRAELKAELDTLRGKQAEAKGKRGKIFDELKKVREDVAKKIKDLNASRSKIPYKTAAEVDAQIALLEKQVESGSMKLVDEKRALNEITTLKRSRKAVDANGDIQTSIEADKARADALSKQLDDPALTAVGERFDAIKAELAEIQKEGDKLYESRNKLFDERKVISAELDKVHTKRKESSAKYKSDQDAYWTKVQEERAKKADRIKAERKAQDDAKKLEVATQLREDAKIPAYETQIEDCQTIIDYLSGKPNVLPASEGTPLFVRKAVAGVEKLVGRTVDASPLEGVVMKKKGDADEDFFSGAGGKKKGTASKKKVSGTSTPVSNTESGTSTPLAEQKLNLPFSVLSAILALSIPPPLSQADVPRAIADIKTKKSWFEANNARVTKDNLEKAEREIARLEGRLGSAASDETEEKVPNGIAEPIPTPAPGAEEPKEKSASLPVSPEAATGAEDTVAEVDEKLAEAQKSE